MSTFVSQAEMFRSGRWAFGPRPGEKSLPWSVVLVRVGVLLLPGTLLLAGALKTWGVGKTPVYLGLGVAFQLLVAGFYLVNRQSWRQPLLASMLLLYLSGQAWLWLGTPSGDWFLHLAQATLLLVSLTVFGYQVLVNPSAGEVRRAHMLAQRLAERKEWPDDPDKCRLLPEVKALRHAMNRDAAPALALMGHPRPAVRMAALSTLEGWQHWRKGQAEYVLGVAQHAREASVRIAAIQALSRTENPVLVERLVEFLRDPIRPVRQATADTLLQDGERRWAWVRNAVRAALSDGGLEDDGPLIHRSRGLSPEMVKDFTGWSGEKGVLSVRAAMTLGVHYGRALQGEPGPALIADLRRQLADPQAPPALRMELAHLLQSHRLLDLELQEKLLDPLNHASLRLVAAEALLECDHEHPGAVGTLRDIARLPNREIGLATARVVQRQLGVDLGLPAGQQPPPAAHTRQAAEVIRKLMMWATDSDQIDVIATPTY